MKRKIVLLTTILSLFFTTCTAPTTNNQITEIRKDIVLRHLQQAEIQKEFDRFKADLRERESGDNWQIINPIGCIGSYQFSIKTLHHLGYRDITLERFRANPEIFSPDIQEEAFMTLVKANELALKHFEHYIGQTISGVVVTKSGLIAAAHLGGVKSVERFLKGTKNATDLYGTSVKDYMKLFAGYEI